MVKHTIFDRNQSNGLKLKLVASENDGNTVMGYVLGHHQVNTCCSVLPCAAMSIDSCVDKREWNVNNSSQVTVWRDGQVGEQNK